MRLNFRQGVVRFQGDVNNTPTHLQKSTNGKFIDLMVTPDPTIITFAHGESDYIIEENVTVRKAWGPFNDTLGTTYYLYWDIDYFSGKLSRGMTEFAPVIQPYEPTVQREGQHWFDTRENVMKLYHKNAWRTVIRAFAATFRNSATIEPEPAGSQVGLNNIRANAGFVMFDSLGDPLKNRFGKFITTEHALSTQVLGPNSANGFKLEGYLKVVRSDQFIPEFHLVSLIGDDLITLADPSDVTREVHGMVGEDFFEGETGRIISHGRVYNEHWAWPDTVIGKPIFCGADGSVTTTPPTTGLCQNVGHIVDRQTIYLNIRIPFVLT